MRRMKLLLASARLAVVSLVGAAPPAAFAVVGGTDVPDGSYPFVATLFDKRGACPETRTLNGFAPAP